MVKDSETRAKSYAQNMNNMNLDKLNNGYNMRVSDKRDSANMTQLYSKQLEE